ncbi:MAG: hypothetical protein M0Z33_02135 [Actinomycetota bacterium]|nr:hypothetical protein [Actinomycetota bacterium]
MSPFAAGQAPVLLGTIATSPGTGTFALTPTTQAVQVITPTGVTKVSIVGASSGASYWDAAPGSGGVMSVAVNEAVDRSLVVTTTGTSSDPSYVTTIPSSGVPASSSSPPLAVSGLIVPLQSVWLPNGPLGVTGVPSGAPLVVAAIGYWNPGPTALEDTFATHYTWTKAIAAMEGSETVAQLWVGEGGSGTTGTISASGESGNGTLTALAFPGAPTTEAGFVDGAGITAVGSVTAGVLDLAPGSLTPSASGEVALVALAGVSSVGAAGIVPGSYVLDPGPLSTIPGSPLVLGVTTGLAAGTPFSAASSLQASASGTLVGALCAMLVVP